MSKQYVKINSAHQIEIERGGVNGAIYRPMYYSTSLKRWVYYYENRSLVQTHGLVSAYRHIHRSLKWLKAQGM